jgi:hypothetical protein
MCVPTGFRIGIALIRLSAHPSAIPRKNIELFVRVAMGLATPHELNHRAPCCALHNLRMGLRRMEAHTEIMLEFVRMSRADVDSLSSTIVASSSDCQPRQSFGTFSIDRPTSRASVACRSELCCISAVAAGLMYRGNKSRRFRSSPVGLAFRFLALLGY